jgi:hypothetical protein
MFFPRLTPKRFQHRHMALLSVLVGFSILWIIERPLGTDNNKDNNISIDITTKISDSLVDDNHPLSSTTTTTNTNIINENSDNTITSNLRHDVTLVIGYFDLKRKGHQVKHTRTMYEDIGKNVLSIQSPMIIFTDDPNLIEVRKKLVPSNIALTHYVKQSLENLTTWKNHYNRISQLMPLDPEVRSFKYSAALFTLYHAKTELVAMAIELNPFQSQKFLWIDLGSLRDWGGINVKEYQMDWPKPSLMYRLGDEGRVILQGVGGAVIPCSSARIINPQEPYNPPLIENIKYTDPLQVPGPVNPGIWFIAGSLFGGDLKSLLKFHQVYSSTLSHYLQQEISRYDLIDQHLMGAIACTRSDLVSIVRPPPKCCIQRVNRKWFFLYMYLGKETFPEEPYSRQELLERGGKIGNSNNNNNDDGGNT